MDTIHRNPPLPPTIRLLVTKGDDEGKIFVVTVPELPGCRTHGRTYEEAIKQGQEAIEGWIMTAKADNAPIPPARNFTAARQNMTI